MALETRLKRWVEAGLLDEPQAQRIIEFEKGHERPLFLYAIAGLGSLAVAIGIVSIIAANWDSIPGRVKIATNLLLLVSGGVLRARYAERWPVWLRDASLLVLYGFTMGSIALIGQVYQLGGTAREAMAMWSLLTLPLMTLGHSGFVAVVWSIGLQATCATWLYWLGEYPIHQEGWALALASAVPWAWLTLGHSSWLSRLRPAYASVFTTFGWIELVLCASIGTHAFYNDTRYEPWNALWVSFGLGAIVVAWLWPTLSRMLGGKTTRLLPLTALLLMYVPARVSAGHWGVLAALTFIGLWLVIAISAHRAGLLNVLNLATAVIGVRIVVVYFEVFGSLLNTGLGLVTGGLLTLLLVWAWWRKKRDFKKQFAITTGRSS